MSRAQPCILLYITCACACGAAAGGCCYAHCCLAGDLGSSLSSLQSCAMVEDDTGRHDRLPPCRFQASVVKFVSTASHSWVSFDPFPGIYRSENSKSVPGYMKRHVSRQKFINFFFWSSCWNASTWILALYFHYCCMSGLHYSPGRRTIWDGHWAEQLWFQTESFIALLVPDPQQVLPCSGSLQLITLQVVRYMIYNSSCSRLND